MSKRSRRQYSTEQKVMMVRRHLVDKMAVSELCNEYKLQPSVFYSWLKQAMDNLGSAFVAATPTNGERREKQLVKQVEQLEAKLAKKDNVIAEISSEYVQLKKALGEA